MLEQIYFFVYQYRGFDHALIFIENFKYSNQPIFLYTRYVFWVSILQAKKQKAFAFIDSRGFGPYGTSTPIGFFVRLFQATKNTQSGFKSSSACKTKPPKSFRFWVVVLCAEEDLNLHALAGATTSR